MNSEGFCNPGHNILELYNVLVQVRVATRKMKLDASEIYASEGKTETKS